MEVPVDSPGWTVSNCCNVFVPIDLRDSPSGYLLGWCHISSSPTIYILGLDQTCDVPVPSLEGCGFVPSVVGRYVAGKTKEIHEPLYPDQKDAPVFVTLRFNNGLVLENAFVCQKTVPLRCCRVFFYEPSSFLSSEFLSCPSSTVADVIRFEEETFVRQNAVERLLTVLLLWERSRRRPANGDAVASNDRPRENQSTDGRSIAHRNAVCFYGSRSLTLFWRILFCSAFVHRLNQFVCQFRSLQESASEGKRKHCLGRRNVISSILLDVVLGIVVLHRLHEWMAPERTLDAIVDSANVVVDHLQALIHWLMGVPAGLKLNYPLNSALGQFFLYHIYLWKTYIAVVKPLLQSVLEMVLWLGWFGFSFQSSLFSDLVSLATFHVYCFYVYAARLYQLHLSGLLSLWRLVRGRKWNPLRQRVDSCAYSTDQLYLGTIIFMILLFLMPTTMLYYVVFATLRVATLTIFGMLRSTIYVTSTVPLYSIFVYLIKSPLVRGNVRFFFCPPTRSDGPLVFEMRTVSAPIQEVWQRTRPAEFGPRDDTTWSALLKNLCFGKLIYPF